MQILNITDNNYPNKLLLIKNPPKKLYVEGNIELLNKKSLAIVGSRKHTSYGENFTKQFASQISNYGICIISGLAIGIDTIAHTYSKDSLGKTIAVIGSGLNKIYPQENISLAKEIINNGGCIISEYEPDSDVIMSNFPKRNRIIVGLSDGVLISEATLKSGSTLTGHLALKENKKVFCLPRNLGETKGAGTNDLIKSGAKLVTQPQDILKEFNINYSENKEIISYKPKKEAILVKEEYKELYKLITNKPININDLVKKSTLNITQLSAELTMMELEGYIKSLPGNEFVRL